jgi:hypothetical protein
MELELEWLASKERQVMYGINQTGYGQIKVRKNILPQISISQSPRISVLDFIGYRLPPEEARPYVRKRSFCFMRTLMEVDAGWPCHIASDLAKVRCC